MVNIRVYLSRVRMYLFRVRVCVEVSVSSPRGHRAIVCEKLILDEVSQCSVQSRAPL